MDLQLAPQTAVAAALACVAWLAGHPTNTPLPPHKLQSFSIEGRAKWDKVLQIQGHGVRSVLDRKLGSERRNGRTSRFKTAFFILSEKKGVLLFMVQLSWGVPLGEGEDRDRWPCLISGFSVRARLQLVPQAHCWRSRSLGNKSWVNKKHKKEM